jgi:hypothetical protein
MTTFAILADAVVLALIAALPFVAFSVMVAATKVDHAAGHEVLELSVDAPAGVRIAHAA